jgi:hypothetical protein
MQQQVLLRLQLTPPPLLLLGQLQLLLGLPWALVTAAAAAAPAGSLRNVLCQLLSDAQPGMLATHLRCFVLVAAAAAAAAAAAVASAYAAAFAAAAAPALAAARATAAAAPASQGLA